MLEKTLESPLDCKEIQPVHPKGNQSWMFIGRTDFKAETPITWPPDAKNCLIWKDPDAGKDWRHEEKGMTEDEIIGWHHNSMAMSLRKLWELVMDRESWRAVSMWLQRVRHDWATELNWTKLILFAGGPAALSPVTSCLYDIHLWSTTMTSEFALDQFSSWNLFLPNCMISTLFGCHIS